MAWRPVDHIVGQAGREQEACGSLRSQSVEGLTCASVMSNRGTPLSKPYQSRMRPFRQHSQSATRNPPADISAAQRNIAA